MSNTDFNEPFDNQLGNFEQLYRSTRQSAVSNAVMDADADPEKAARAQQLADATGAHPALVHSDLENFETQNKAALTNQILSRNQYLQDFANSHPLATKIASDDWGQLDTVSTWIKRLGAGFTPSGFIKGGNPIWDEVVKGFKAGYDEGGLNEETQRFYSYIDSPIWRDFVSSGFGGAIVDFEKSMRATGAAIQGAGAAFGEINRQLGASDTTVAAATRDMSVFIQMAMSGQARLGVHPEMVTQINEAARLARKVKPYIDSGTVPPTGLDPKIDEAHKAQLDHDLGNLDEALKESQASATRERNPEIFAGFIRQHTDAKIGISAEAVRKLYGDKPPEPEDGKLGFVPNLAEQLSAAEPIGGDIEVPLADWLAKVDPEVAKELHDDIRVRPGGVTKNELENLKTEPTIGGPVDNVRAASKLEPLFDKGEEKKLRLEREADTGEAPTEANYHKYNLIDEKGKPVGKLDFDVNKDGKSIFIGGIEGTGGLGSGDFGPTLIRSLLEQVRRDFPDVEEIEGYRVSGARDKAGQPGYVKISIPLKKLLQIDDIDRFAAIIEGGDWLDYGQGVSAKVKPTELYTENEKAIKAVVDRELSRIVPKYVEWQAAHEIKFGDIKPAGVYNQFDNRVPIILWSLESGDALKTARHEALHHLRQMGFFTQTEWRTLEKAAMEGDWVGKHGIGDKYADQPRRAQLEEAIAEEFGQWRAGRDTTESLHPIFEKLKALLERIKKGLLETLGRASTANDLFLAADIGEIGSREGVTPQHPAAFKPKFQVEESKKGFVRFYHGADEGASTSSGGGRWVTPDVEYARRFRAGDKDKEVHYVDIPKGDPIEVAAREWDEVDEQAKTNAVGRYRSIELPEEWAKKLKPYDEGTPETRMAEREVFAKANAIGMTVDQYRRYMSLIEKRRAEDFEANAKRTLATEQKKQTKEWKENRAALRPQVADDIRNRPDVAADTFLRDGVLYGDKLPERPRLSGEGLSEEQRGALKDVIAKDGIHADDLAGLFGYGSGGELVNRLAQLAEQRSTSGMQPTDFIRRVIDAETDRQMEAKYGKLDENILNEVKDQVLSETQMDLLHEEVLHLGMQAGSELPISKADLQTWVKDQFAKTVMSTASTDKYLALAGKAGRDAEAALLKEDYSEAFKQKQRQFLAVSMANEAKKLEKSVGQFERTAKRFSAREVATVDQEYTNFIHDILLRVGRPVKRSVQDLADSIARGEQKNLEDFVDYKEQHDLREVPVAEILYDPAFRRDFDNLTVEEFNAVHDSIKTLVANGRDENKINRQGEEADLKVIKDKMIEQLQQFAEKHYDATGRRWLGPIPPGVARPLRTYLVSHLQLEALFNRWDRGDPRGVFTQYIARELASAANNEAALEKKYSRMLREIADKGNFKELVDNPIFIDPLSREADGTGGTPIQMTRKNLRAILLNAGNSSNLDKLARGYQIKSDVVMQWLHQHATKEDWNWAQKMGDIFAEIKKESDIMYRGLTGIEPESIGIQPVQTPHGEYAGWYYPVIYHPVWEGRSKKLMGKDALEQDNYVRATTPRGYTKQRTGYAAPISLDLDVGPARMRQMLHDIAMRPSVIQASKIFYDKAIRDAITKHYGLEYRELLIPYLRDVANAGNYKSDAQFVGAKALEFARQNMISTLIGLNPGTVMKHGPTAAMNSITEVGPINFLKAVKGLLSINDQTGETNWNFAMENSQELQRRHRNYNETLGGATDKLLGQESLRDTLIKIGSTPVAVSDLLSAVPTWMAKYESSMREGLSHGESISDADTAVRRAHGSTAITNRAGIARGGALASWLSSLYGFFSHILNRQYELAWRAADTLQLAKEGEMKEALKQTPKLTAMFFSYIIFPALVEEAVTPMTNKEHESWGMAAAKGLVHSVTSSWIGIRDVVAAMLYDRDPSAGLLATAFKSVTDLVRDIKHDKPMSKQRAGGMIQHAATFVGVATGLMNAQEGRVGKFLYNVKTGQEKPKTPTHWWQGLRYGTMKGHT